MKEIMLTNGKITQVDDIDFIYLLGISAKWYLCNKHIQGKNNVFMHKEIAKRMGLNISKIIDHKDRNTLNNQRFNLREANKSEDVSNRKANKNNKLGHKGIYFIPRLNKYRVRIWKNYDCIHIGLFYSLEEAINASNKARIKYHGEFAYKDVK